ncbi:hypothetical protein HDU98_005152, partial [Podochytrium sp. JEL0797]
MDEFSIQMICGYSPEIAAGTVPQLPVPLSNPLTDWFATNSESVMSAPIRYHENTPYLIPQLAFLTAQSPLIVLQNARHLAPNDANPLQLPNALKAKVALTDACDASTSTFSSVSSGRVVYRSDLVTVETCLEAGVEEVEGLVGAVGAVGGEVPVVSLVSSKKDKSQKFVLINVNWSPYAYNAHFREAKLLLFLMEYFRVMLGHPITVAGVFDDDLEQVLRLGLDETETWRNFYPPTPGFLHSAVWAPTVPTTFKQDVSSRHAPVAALTSIESCLAPPTNTTAFGSCDALKEYGKQFRKSVGGVLAPDRMLEKHTFCASAVSRHFPVVYTILKAEESISVVSFNLGGLSLSRIQRLVKSHPQLFVYLSGFDIVLLQTTRMEMDESRNDPEEEFDFEKVGERVTELVTEALRNRVSENGRVKIKEGEFKFLHSMSVFRAGSKVVGGGGVAPSNLHVLVKDVMVGGKKGFAKRLQMTRCTSESYGSRASLLGCAFLVKGTDPFFISTLDDAAVGASLPVGYDVAVTPGYDPMTAFLSAGGEDRAVYIPPVLSGAMLRSPLTNPAVDLAFSNLGVMKRMYASLCMGVLLGGCGGYPVTAVFVGSWGWVEERGGKGGVNGTFGEFKAVMEGVERE